MRAGSTRGDRPSTLVFGMLGYSGSSVCLARRAGGRVACTVIIYPPTYLTFPQPKPTKVSAQVTWRVRRCNAVASFFLDNVGAVGLWRSEKVC